MLSIRRNAEDALGVMKRAAEWLVERGMPLWQPSDFENGQFLDSISKEDLITAYVDDTVAGAMVLQWEDTEFWPHSRGDSGFIHKLCVERRFAGKGVAGALVEWAKNEVRARKRAFLRLDCSADRPKLCHVYENLGFSRVDRRMVGPYDIAFYEMRVGHEDDRKRHSCPPHADVRAASSALLSDCPTVREFKGSDAEAASALIRRCWTTMRLGNYDERGIHTQIEGTTPDKLKELASSTRFYVAEHNGELVGFGGFDKERARLLFVQPESQRKGIGSSVLRRTLADARRQGIARLMCNSTTFAEPFYRKHGFVKKGMLDFGTIHFVQMAIELGRGQD